MENASESTFKSPGGSLHNIDDQLPDKHFDYEVSFISFRASSSRGTMEHLKGTTWLEYAGHKNIPHCTINPPWATHLIRASVYLPSIGITFPFASFAKSKLNTDKTETMVAQTVASAACRPTQILHKCNLYTFGRRKTFFRLTVFQSRMSRWCCRHSIDHRV